MHIIPTIFFISNIYLNCNFKSLHYRFRCNYKMRKTNQITINFDLITNLYMGSCSRKRNDLSPDLSIQTKTWEFINRFFFQKISCQKLRKKKFLSQNLIYLIFHNYKSLQLKGKNMTRALNENSAINLTYWSKCNCTQTHWFYLWSEFQVIIYHVRCME